jgi:hypothetical protein
MRSEIIAKSWLQRLRGKRPPTFHFKHGLAEAFLTRIISRDNLSLRVVPGATLGHSPDNQRLAGFSDYAF